MRCWLHLYPSHRHTVSQSGRAPLLSVAGAGVGRCSGRGCGSQPGLSLSPLPAAGPPPARPSRPRPAGVAGAAAHCAAAAAPGGARAALLLAPHRDPPGPGRAGPRLQLSPRRCRPGSGEVSGGRAVRRNGVMPPPVPSTRARRAKGEQLCTPPPPRRMWVRCRGLGERLRAPPGPAAEGRGLSGRAAGAGGSWLCLWLGAAVRHSPGSLSEAPWECWSSQVLLPA